MSRIVVRIETSPAIDGFGVHFLQKLKGKPYQAKIEDGYVMFEEQSDEWILGSPAFRLSGIGARDTLQAMADELARLGIYPEMNKSERDSALAVAEERQKALDIERARVDKILEKA